MEKLRGGLICPEINLLHGDCLELMKDIPDGSVDLVLTDPPYNIGKSKDWDKWDTVQGYINFMGLVFSETERILKPTGSLYFFHNYMPTISRLMEWLRANTNFRYNSFIVLNKENWRAISWKNPSKANNLRCWFNTCEYALCYVKADGLHSEFDRTGWDKVKLDVNNFTSLRRYAWEMLIYINGGNSKQVERDLGSHRAEHFFYCKPSRKDVLDSVGGKVDHFTRYGSTQWEFCTEETYNELIDKFGIDKWEGFRTYESLRQEYESLRQEYESLRFTHNLDPNHNNVMAFKRDKGPIYHACQKPQDILQRFINCSSNPGEVVLDMFMGSGSTGVACVNTGRNFIGIEKDDKYFDVAKERINSALLSLDNPREEV